MCRARHRAPPRGPRPPPRGARALCAWRDIIHLRFPRQRAIAIACVLLLAFLAATLPRALGRGTGWAAALERPLAAVSIAATSWARAAATLVRAPGRLRELEAQLAELTTERTAWVHARAEAEALAAERGSEGTRTVPGTPFTARVLAATVNATSHELLIATGDRAIPVGAPALAHGALIGTVTASGASRASVRLLTDPRTRIAVQRASVVGTIGILAARVGGGVAVTHIPRDTALASGDTIVTGLANAGIPDGIPVGTIADLRDDADGFFRTAAVDPIGDPNGTPFVTILLPGV